MARVGALLYLLKQAQRTSVLDKKFRGFVMGLHFESEIQDRVLLAFGFKALKKRDNSCYNQIFFYS